ncbi:SAM-dependent methyltransferase [Streptacidiphilus albus]|uniref:SAM-dependent methyltransferase n=1 Tax=Streptacidiphilus albus TaxID=105425 RepID=UPI00054C518E|nr:SAM-dependent methyltransferase [Streptacidiphilus albus]
MKPGENDAPSVELRTDIPHPARIYDYLLGGKDNFPADREASAEISSVWPNLPKSMRANRSFMRRVTHYLAAERGIRQFLDIGTGLPTSPNLHEVAQAVDPTARVAYVDNDPMVLVHARALLASTPEGRTTYIDADLHDAESILTSPTLLETLDLEQPVALSLIAVLQFVTDEDAAHSIIDGLIRQLAPGSFLALSTVTADSAPEEVTRGIAAYAARGIPERIRTREEVELLFSGLELVDPGVCLVHRWHPDAESAATLDEHVHMHGGVAVKA